MSREIPICYCPRNAITTSTSYHSDVPPPFRSSSVICIQTPPPFEFIALLIPQPDASFEVNQPGSVLCISMYVHTSPSVDECCRALSRRSFCSKLASRTLQGTNRVCTETQFCLRSAISIRIAFSRTLLRKVSN